MEISGRFWGHRSQISWKVQITMQGGPEIRELYCMSLNCSRPKFFVREVFIIAARCSIKASKQV